MATPSNDMQTVKFEFNGLKLEAKKRFPVYKFMKVVFENPVAAFDIALMPESIALLEEADMDFDEFADLVAALTEALGVTPKN